ncbi:alkaline phosphatase [Paenibacillus sp. J31TS4]|uniref:DedA family protein n=1 Tax=Paenibacillus sp. J31TS4 TaxID=2807195 RepID=UPI001B20694B|nr:DedA family protein [Paenibacillus sp. J31TS4]GIP41423.1 alkaline phosphatase [Paenibacillus sp. J31TS4]
MEWMQTMFDQYGYLLLVLGLFAESLALPFPGELAMAVAGHMAALGGTRFGLTVACSYGGALTGTILTYALGRRLGTPFFEAHGRYFLLKPERLRLLTDWFGRYGDKLIFVSYFVPGLRHFTGYVAGTLRVPLRTLLLYNGAGGLLWVLVYITLGYRFGGRIEEWLHALAGYAAPAILIGVVLAAGLALYKRRRRQASGAARLREAASRLTQLRPGGEPSTRPSPASEIAAERIGKGR